jgi:hypothetical protein
VTLPFDSKLEILSKGLFQNSGVVSLVLPSVRHLADDVFGRCNSLRSVKFTVSSQSKEQRKREIRIPFKLFDGMDVHVIYPQGTLKHSRQLMKTSIIGDYI